MTQIEEDMKIRLTVKNSRVMHNRMQPPALTHCFFLVVVVLGFAAIYCYITQKNESTGSIEFLLSPSSNNANDQLSILRNATEHDLKDFNVFTFRGYISLAELNEEVFLPLGYNITKPTLPVPTLQMLNVPTCDVIFSEWLKVSKKPQPVTPPTQLPIVDADVYVLNGYVALTWSYMNNNTFYEHKPTNWEKMAEYMPWSKTQLAGIEYQAESESMYNAMSGYPLNGMSGFIVGSMQPWLEVMVLKHGAKKILTVEHYPLDIPIEFQDRLSEIHPLDFAKNWQKYAGTFDFAASFSNIQHYGLGRFGDPLDPIGDLREMLKIKCMLKKGGLLYLGVPIGTDSIQYNLQRIYGSIRMSMMLYGYEWIATYSFETDKPIDLNSILLHSKGVFHSQHYTLVLKKL